VTAWADRLSRAVAALVLALLALRLLEAIPAHSLWQDEWSTLNYSFAPTSWAERLWFLSGPVDAHFPTFYLVTRLLGELLAFSGQGVEWLVRLPLTLLTVGALALAGRWAFPGERSVAAAALAAALPGILLTAGDWTLHAGEGRMYGLMGVLGMAMVLASARGHAGRACACGLALVLLHPFGLLVGLAPALAILARHRLGPSWGGELDRRLVRRTAWASGVTLAVLVLWLQLKFVSHQTGGFGIRRRGGDMAKVLSGLDVRAAVLFALATIAGAVALAFLLRRRSEREPAPTPALRFAVPAAAALCLTLGLGVAVLALLRPGAIVAMPRYVAWIDPPLWTGVAAALAMAADAAARRLGLEQRPRAWAALSVAAALATGGWSLHLLRTVPLGAPWGDGLREAAQHLEVTIRPGDAVTTDTNELFPFFPPYVDGYACRGAPQILPYLSPSLRARMSCQDAKGRVTFGPAVERVLLVREPIPVLTGRAIVLDEFRQVDETRFANTVVEVWERAR
jgi:hypothetical protein